MCQQACTHAYMYTSLFCRGPPPKSHILPTACRYQLEHQRILLWVTSPRLMPMRSGALMQISHRLTTACTTQCTELPNTQSTRIDPVLHARRRDGPARGYHSGSKHTTQGTPPALRHSTRAPWLGKTGGGAQPERGSWWGPPVTPIPGVTYPSRLMPSHQMAAGWPRRIPLRGRRPGKVEGRGVRGLAPAPVETCHPGTARIPRARRVCSSQRPS